MTREEELAQYSLKCGIGMIAALFERPSIQDFIMNMPEKEPNPHTGLSKYNYTREFSEAYKEARDNQFLTDQKMSKLCGFGGTRISLSVVGKMLEDLKS